MTPKQLRDRSHKEKAWLSCKQNAEMDYRLLFEREESNPMKLLVEDDQRVRDLVNNGSLSEEPARS
jgi:hypothetical protein